MVSISQGLISRIIDYISPGNERGKLSILIYHRVLKEYDPFLAGDVIVEEFDWQLALLSKHFNVLSLTEAVDRLRSNNLPPRAVSITFDDGYADNEENALPLLNKYNLPATFFIATGYIENGCMWNDRIIESIRGCQQAELVLNKDMLGEFSLATADLKIAAIDELIGKIKYLPYDLRSDTVDAIVTETRTSLPDNIMMNKAQVKNLFDSGMTIGAHTENHPILSQIPDLSAQDEIHHGRETLEDWIGEKIELFAYPNGKKGVDYDHRHVEIVKQLGFSAAVCTNWGFSTAATDPFQLPRFTPWDRKPIMFAARMLKNLVSNNN